MDVTLDIFSGAKFVVNLVVDLMGNLEVGLNMRPGEILDLRMDVRLQEELEVLLSMGLHEGLDVSWIAGLDPS